VNPPSTGELLCHADWMAYPALTVLAGLENMSVGQQRGAVAALARLNPSILVEMAERAPDAYLPNLASSLHNLSVRLSEVGGGRHAGRDYRSRADPTPNSPSNVPTCTAANSTSL